MDYASSYACAIIITDNREQKPLIIIILFFYVSGEFVDLTSRAVAVVIIATIDHETSCLFIKTPARVVTEKTRDESKPAAANTLQSFI